MYNIISLRQMNDFQNERNTKPLILYFLTLILALVFYYPMQEVEQFHQAEESTLKLAQRMMMVKQSAQVDLQLDELFAALNENPYRGIWVNDMKQSRLLENDKGTIEIRTCSKNISDVSEGYDLFISVFDGQFRDSGHYEIQIESSFIKSDMDFTGNHFKFQAKSPLIGIYQSMNIFFHENAESKYQNNSALYIEKLKFRINLDGQNLHIEFLIGAQNDINIISSKMVDSHKFYTHFLLLSILVGQLGLQLWGVSNLTQQSQSSDILRKSLSFRMIEYVIGFDLAQLGIMVVLFFAKTDLLIFTIPISLSFYTIFWHERGLLKTIDPHEQEVQEEGLRKSLTQFKKCLMKGLCISLLFYLNNMHFMLFVAFFGLYMFPQIHENFQKGIKITYDLKWMMLFLVPRVLIILPIRIFSRVFLLENSYSFAIFCLLLVVFQVGLLYLQKNYGSRSILPKFLTPKGFSEFKFFMNQDQNHVCFQCQKGLKLIPDIAQVSQSILFHNKIVVTPCNHKFHLPCLMEWMQSCPKCPACSCILPPMDQEEEEEEE